MSKKKYKKRSKRKQKVISSSTNEKKASSEDSFPQIRTHDDHLKLSQAKANWLFGEWSQLTCFQYQEVENHSERGLLALLVASAHQQLNQHEQARDWGKQALSWGCSPKVAAKILISSLHNTFGRIAALKNNDAEAYTHFQAAIQLVELQNSDLMTHTRSIRELAKLGLLPQAAAYIDKVQQSLEKERPVKQKALNSILRTELELLNQELSLAQQRQQLFSKGSGTAVLNFEDAESWKKQLEKKSVSQLGQDLWVLEQTGYKRNGFFVEFGATDGVLLSNTYLLEKEFGWDGICAEPNPKYFEKLKENRKCTISDACISGETGKEVQFIFAGAFGGDISHANIDIHADKRAAYKDADEVANLQTISLNDFLVKYHAPKDIDYLSIDTEGSEYDILKRFPFDQWSIKFLTIEHNFTEMREKIRSLLRKRGYHNIENQWEDWFYKA